MVSESGCRRSRCISDSSPSGARSPVPMNFGELIPALRSGAMDGQENPLHVIESAKLYEVQKYLSVWQYSFDPIVMCVNRDWWVTRTKEQQDLLRACAAEACAEQRKAVKEREAQHLETLRKEGMEIVVLTDGQREAFRQSAAAIYSEYRNPIGAELMDKFTTGAKQLRERS